MADIATAGAAGPDRPLTPDGERQAQAAVHTLWSALNQMNARVRGRQGGGVLTVLQSNGLWWAGLFVYGVGFFAVGALVALVIALPR